MNGEPYDVAIVGYGPTGMVLALLLGAPLSPADRARISHLNAENLLRLPGT